MCGCVCECELNTKPSRFLSLSLPLPLYYDSLSLLSSTIDMTSRIITDKYPHSAYSSRLFLFISRQLGAKLFSGCLSSNLCRRCYTCSSMGFIIIEGKWNCTLMKTYYFINYIMVRMSG